MTWRALENDDIPIERECQLYMNAAKAARNILTQCCIATIFPPPPFTPTS